MHEVRVLVREIASNLPDDADWDRVWTSIISNFGHAAIKANIPYHCFESVVGSMPDAVDWDDIWGKVMAESYCKSVYPAGTTPDQTPIRVAAQNKEDHGAISSAPVAQTTIREHASTQGLEGNRSASEGLRQMNNRNSTQHRRKGLFLRNLSYGIGVGGILLLGWWDSTQYEGGYGVTTSDRILYGVVFVIAFAMLFKLVVTLHRASRALLQMSAEEALLQDTRPPVLYLRAFQADQITRDKGQSLGHTEEEQWSNVLSDIGPVIALSSPLNNILVPGAARLNADANNWQKVVENYLETSGLIVIRLGTTNSLRWEIEKAVKIVDLKRLIFLVPNRREFNFSEFRAYIKTLLGISVPDLKKKNLLRRIGLRIPLTQNITDFLSIETILIFDEEGTPSLQDIPLKFSHILRSPLKCGLTASMKYALKPVFENTGITWTKPKLKPGPVLMVILFGGGTLSGILESIGK